MTKQRILLFALLLILLTWGIVSERIPVNSETGWDGKHYSTLTSQVDQLLVAGEVDSYQFYRLLPPLMAHTFLRIAGVDPIESHHVVTIFLLLNSIMVVIMALLFFKLSSKMQWSATTELIGFSALFFNFAVLKQLGYYPVLTDIFAYFFGFCLIYFYMLRSNVGMLVTLVAGSITYPLFFITGAILFIRPEQKWVSKAFAYVTRYFKWIFVALFLVVFGYYLIDASTLLQTKYVMHVNETLMQLSVVLTLIFTWFVCVRFERSTPILTHNEGNRNMLFRLLISALYFVLLIIVSKLITKPEEVFTSRTFLLNIFQQSFSNPLAFLVFHAAYVGPLIVLLLFFPHKFIRAAHQLGIAVAAYVFMYVLLGIGTETRQFINAWPVCVISACVMLEHTPVSKQLAIAFVGCSILTSHVYLSINQPGIYETYEYGKFPEQFYFMHHGPFATDWSYAVNLISALLVAAVFGVTQKFFPNTN